MESSPLSVPEPSVSRPAHGSSPAPAGSSAMSTTKLLRAVLAGLRPAPSGRTTARWRDRRADWLTLPAGWTRVQAGELVIAVPGSAPGGTLLMLAVEPVRVVASGSIDADFRRAASAPGLWSSDAGSTVRDVVDGWTVLAGAGALALDGTVYPALTAVARRNALRARFWAVADSEDTRARYETEVRGAIRSVRRFVPGVVRDPAARASVRGPVRHGRDHASP